MEGWEHERTEVMMDKFAFRLPRGGKDIGHS